MHKSKYNNYYLYSTIIAALLVLLFLIISMFNPYLSYFLPQFILCSIIFLTIEFFFAFSKSKKTGSIRLWYEDFMNKHINEFETYKDEANKAVHKYILTKIIVLQIYILSMIVILCTFFIQLEFTYDIGEILILSLKFYGYIFVEVIAYSLVNMLIHKKYYFHYLDPKNNNYVYLYMTYLLLQIKNVDKVYLNYNDLINTSASLTRLLCFEDSYEYLKVWKSNLKKIHPLYSFLYIEHCLFDFVMLDRHEDVNAAYNDYRINLTKYPKQAKNKVIEKCTFYVDLLYAYHNKNYQLVIDLYKNGQKYFSKDEYMDSHNYILYKSYLHIDEQKALELYNNNQDNPFFKKENV